MKHTAALIGLLALGACACDPRTPDAPTLSAAPTAGTGEVFYGRQVATRGCGGCHAVGGGASPVPTAPSFADLHLRYPAGGLEQLLSQGMVQPSDGGPEEGSSYSHPNMPAVKLDRSEIAALKAYLRSLEPPR